MTMSQQQNKCTITFGELHHYMMLDPFYGVESSATDSIINGIYLENTGNARYNQFENHFTSSPCKNDQHRYLIYLWCGLMGLPAYRDSALLNWQWNDFLENWTQDFEIRLDELRDFLRQHLWPLPAAFFPSEVDNTERKVALDEAEFVRTFHEITSVLPLLEDKLEELKKIPPESMKARQQKKIEIENIEQQIAAINPGNNKNDQELPSERNQIEYSDAIKEPEKGSPEWRKQNARKAADARHNQPGGSREKRQQIREIWATGKYSSRDLCAEHEFADLGISYSTARKALKNTPKPKAT